MPLPREVTADLFRAIAEYTYDWETWVDTEGVTRWINGAVARITGHTVEACLAMPDYPLALADAADRPILERVLRDARAGGSGNDVEFRVRTKAGELRWVAISWQSVRSVEDVSLGYRTSIRDIDERKHMEAELQRLQHKAEALAHARSELLANVSHELRSPAHCIAGFADLLLDGPLTDKQRHYLSIIVEQCRSMQRQVEDLLSLTALEAGGVELTPETVDLFALAQSLLDVNQPTVEASGVTLRSDVRVQERFVEADALRLQQILRNLIDNALKFTAQGTVTLVVRREGPAERPRLCFDVTDTGRGMDPSQVDVLLLPFRQGDASSSKRHGGVGLGLAIVQRLVSAMEGELSIQTAPQQGTRVTVSLPWVSAKQAVAEPVVARASQLSGRALVVDDSPPARELLAGLLEACGFSCAEAASAQAAEALVLQQAFDVMFIDYQMPDSDGAESALRLRRCLASTWPGRHVPIFIVTANVFAHEQLREARSAVDGVLAKPLSRAALQRVLQQLPMDSVAAAEARDAPLSEEAVHDLEATRHKSGKSLLAYLLPQVTEDFTAAHARAVQRLALRDHAGLGRAAHELSGHASLVGAARAASLSNQLELLMEEQQPDFARAEILLAGCLEAWRAAHVLLLPRAASD